YWVSACGRVKFGLLDRYTIGSRYRFQDLRKVKIATAAIADRASGNAIRAKIPNRLSPSIRPASSSSPGRVTKNCRMMNVASTLGAPRIGITINGQCVSIRPSEFTILNSGTIVTSEGTSNPVSTTTNSTFAPGNWIRANAYPASEATAIVPSVTSTAMYTLLKYCWANGCSSNTCW